MGLNSTEINFSIRNLNSLTSFGLFVPSTIDENITRKLIHQLPTIQQLSLSGKLSYFNLDDLVNLKNLDLGGSINDNFNFDLFKNLCNRLESLRIYLPFGNGSFFNLFNGHIFPNLTQLDCKLCKIVSVKKNFLDKFPMLRELFLNNCLIENVEEDAFSNVQYLVRLELSRNYLQLQDKRIFSQLKHLEHLIY